MICKGLDRAEVPLPLRGFTRKGVTIPATINSWKDALDFGYERNVRVRIAACLAKIRSSKPLACLPSGSEVENSKHKLATSDAIGTEVGQPGSRHQKIARIVELHDPTWKKSSNAWTRKAVLWKVCKELDREAVPVPLGWVQAASSWHGPQVSAKRRRRSEGPTQSVNSMIITIP